MVKRLVAIAFIYACTCIAWMILGSTLLVRSENLGSSTRSAVSKIWGSEQLQSQPTVLYREPVQRTERRTVNGKQVTEVKTVMESFTHPLGGSDVVANMNLDPRQKGLLWFSTYKVGFQGAYRVKNTTTSPHKFEFTYDFPDGAVFDDFSLAINGKKIEQLELANGLVTTTFPLAAGAEAKVDVAYRTQGLDAWRYDFGQDVRQVKDFKLVIHTDFDKVDFPENTISPTAKDREGKGWKLEWRYNNLLTAVQIGLTMPKKLNPGPWASQVTFAAPVSLFLFLFLIFVIAALRNLRLHPMHYFFLSSSFFSFHLLLAYMVDLLDVYLAVGVASVVSLILVISYMRLVVSARFAFVDVAIAQLVYLVLFSCTFFLEGYTGLAITVLCIATLFVVMQATAKVDWEEVFAAPTGPALPGLAKVLDAANAAAANAAAASAPKPPSAPDGPPLPPSGA